MIALTYINKKAATIEAMRDYENMKHIIATTSQEIKNEYEDIFNVRSSQIDGMPKIHNSQAGVNKVVNGLDKINFILERYRQAMEYMHWFEPAWETLNEEEKLIMEEFYMQGNQRSGAIARIEAKINYSPRQIDRFRHKSLERLALHLYGG